MPVSDVDDLPITGQTLEAGGSGLLGGLIWLALWAALRRVAGW